MKYFLLLLLIAFAQLNVYSQDQELWVNNDTDCAHTYTVFAYIDGENPCEEEYYQLKNPLTIGADDSIMYDDGWGFYGVGSTQWYDHSTNPPSIVLDTQISGDMLIMGVKENIGGGISLVIDEDFDCVYIENDSGVCSSNGFTATLGGFFGNVLFNITYD